MPHLVRKVELVWLVDAFEPAKTADLVEYLPIDHRSVYLRLRHLYRSGYFNRANKANANHEGYDWSLTDDARAWLANQDMPDLDSVDLREYFAGRTDEINPLSILEALALEDDEWQSSRTAYDALPFTNEAIRLHLHELHEQGDLELETGHAYQWRLTEQGRARLAEADEGETENSGEYVWLDAYPPQS